MKREIINLTQHIATPEQVADGVVELSPGIKKIVKDLLTFNTPPLRIEMSARAKKIAKFAEAWDYAMIGGAPFFMSVLEKELENLGVHALYSFSVRKSEEELVDGLLLKTTTFVHTGFVEGV